jgi:amidase
MEESPSSGISRRDVLKLGAATAGAAALAPMAGTLIAQAASAPSDLNEATVAQLTAAMAAGHLNSIDIVNFYLQRIQTLDQGGPRVNSVIEVNPDAKTIAMQRDAQRRAGLILGPLHGIPILLKDNVDTHDGMQSAAGSLGLVGTAPVRDSTVAARLRAAGAVILGKSNLSEWANFRSFFSTSGWSGRGGQCNNPYAVDRNPCGSSSGSGAATSANFTAVSIGTETDGSIVCPANENGVVGIKPTVGLVSRAGVVPISHTQDTVGPHGRTVADAATVLTAIAGGHDSRDPATAAAPSPMDYRRFLDPKGLKGARIGVARQYEGFSPHTDTVFEDALTTMAAAGATLVDITFPHFDEINSGGSEFTVLLNDFKHDLNVYFSTRVGVPLAGKTLTDAIAFNVAHADQEMPFFGQEIFELADTFSGDLNDPTYLAALARDRFIGATEGIDQILQQNNVMAIVAETDTPAWPTDLINSDHFVFGTSSVAAIVGYPIIVVPMGMSFGLPVGMSFIGTAFSEPTLIKLASGFEAARNARQAPQFLSTLPFNTKGMATSPHRRRPFETRVAPVRI